MYRFNDAGISVNVFDAMLAKVEEGGTVELIGFIGAIRLLAEMRGVMSYREDKRDDAGYITEHGDPLYAALNLAESYLRVRIDSVEQRPARCECGGTLRADGTCNTGR